MLFGNQPGLGRKKYPCTGERGEGNARDSRRLEL